jgi:hypothetical protein
MLKVGKLYYVIVLEQNVQYSAIDWGITEHLIQASHKDGLFMLYKVEIIRYISRMDDFLASRCSNAFQGISRRFIRKVVHHALDLASFNSFTRDLKRRINSSSRLWCSSNLLQPALNQFQTPFGNPDPAAQNQHTAQ